MTSFSSPRENRQVWIGFNSGLESFCFQDQIGSDSPVDWNHFCVGTQVVKTWLKVKCLNLSLLVVKNGFDWITFV